MMEKYRELHIKLTPQRLAILSFLDGNKSHPSAEDIYKAVLKQFPTMSFATVYNTLEALKNRGNVQELKIDSHKKRYDPDISRHHHLICLKCSKIIDIHKDFKIALSEDLIHGFDLMGNSVEFYGICQKCKKHH
ncbi:MAG TPA: transcriptional repressor [Nitrospirae bacterium]|nr:peroxide operon regulator [bacterium BMS3Bbin08]HDH05329.1 transcriptional repressor [Nitrospirota bacterium]